MDRERRKRTIYLGRKDEAAVAAIRQRVSLKTKASAIRWAIQETERRFTAGPSDTATATLRLVEYVESMTLLSDLDTRNLSTLCTKARSTLEGVDTLPPKP